MTWMIILAALQITDITTTLKIFKLGGVERNPVMAKMMNEFGDVETLVVVKAVIVGSFALLLPQDPVIEQIIIGVCAWYVYVIYNNLKVIRRLRNE